MSKLTKADAEAFWKCADKNGDGELTPGELRRAVARYCEAQGKPCPDDKNIIVSFFVSQLHINLGIECTDTLGRLDRMHGLLS